MALLKGTANKYLKIYMHTWNKLVYFLINENLLAEWVQRALSIF